MKTYHPPMTGLEAHMEEEVAVEAHRPNEALKHAQELAQQRRQPASFQETEIERKTEEAMHLDQ